MRTALLLLAILATPAFAGAIYKWVDEKGVTHYSDQPVPGATRMELSTGSNRWDSRASSVPASSPASSEPETPAGPPYRLLEITKPRQGDNVINTGGKVQVQISTDPMVQRGHTLRLVLDGQVVGDYPLNAPAWELSDVTRGQHTLVLAVEDSKGARLQTSAPTSFFVRQESIAQPPVGPTLRPPPKPQPRN